MIFDYEDYEKACLVIQKKNAEYLNLFEMDLINSGLKEKTIIRHLRNVDFYINTYLLREEPRDMEAGTFLLDFFLGDFFIRKCMWSTPGNIKTNAASIKKFYKCMLDHEKIKRSSYDELCRDIKDNLTTWQINCEIYNDPDAPNPFFCPF
ncbi:MAG: hypothetical protein ACI4EO_01410 [Blautia sp.]